MSIQDQNKAFSHLRPKRSKKKLPPEDIALDKLMSSTVQSHGLQPNSEGERIFKVFYQRRIDRLRARKKGKSQ